jgi:hypothetical protein
MIVNDLPGQEHPYQEGLHQLLPGATVLALEVRIVGMIAHLPVPVRPTGAVVHHHLPRENRRGHLAEPLEIHLDGHHHHQFILIVYVLHKILPVKYDLAHLLLVSAPLPLQHSLHTEKRIRPDQHLEKDHPFAPFQDLLLAGLQTSERPLPAQVVVETLRLLCHQRLTLQSIARIIQVQWCLPQDLEVTCHQAVVLMV